MKFLVTLLLLSFANGLLARANAEENHDPSNTDDYPDHYDEDIEPLDPNNIKKVPKKNGDFIPVIYFLLQLLKHIASTARPDGSFTLDETFLGCRGFEPYEKVKSDLEKFGGLQEAIRTLEEIHPETADSGRFWDSSSASCVTSCAKNLKNVCPSSNTAEAGKNSTVDYPFGFFIAIFSDAAKKDAPFANFTDYHGIRSSGRDDNFGSSSSSSSSASDEEYRTKEEPIEDNI